MLAEVLSELSTLELALYGFAAVFCLRVAAFARRYWTICQLQRLYVEWIKDPSRPHLAGYTSRLQALMKESGTSDALVPGIELLGYGFVAKAKVPVVPNIARRDQRFIGANVTIISQVKGYFHDRLLENFSALFWLEYVFFLPKRVLAYLGLDQETALFKVVSGIAQLGYWGKAMWEFYQSVAGS